MKKIDKTEKGCLLALVGIVPFLWLLGWLLMWIWVWASDMWQGWLELMKGSRG